MNFPSKTSEKNFLIFGQFPTLTEIRKLKMTAFMILQLKSQNSNVKYKLSIATRV